MSLRWDFDDRNLRFVQLSVRELEWILALAGLPVLAHLG